MAENVAKQQPTHTGIPISEFLAGRGEPPPPPPPPAHTGIPISEFLAGRGAAPTTTMPGPSPGTEAALARGMEAVRVGGATAARPHGGIHISGRIDGVAIIQFGFLDLCAATMVGRMMQSRMAGYRAAFSRAAPAAPPMRDWERHIRGWEGTATCRSGRKLGRSELACYGTLALPACAGCHFIDTGSEGRSTLHHSSIFNV